jgi:FkbM family methyltransferase
MFTDLPQSSNDLYQQVLRECLIALKFNTFLDNYDSERFENVSNNNSMLFDANTYANQFRWFHNNYEKIYDAYKILGDEYSKKMYLYILAYRLAGFHSVRIPVEFNENSEKYIKYKESEKFVESKINLDGMFGGLKHYDFYFEGVRYKADCFGLKYCLYRKQYFYNKQKILIEPNLGDYVIDGGACLGDTSIVFANKVGEEGCVYSFDPIWEHLQVLKYNVEQNSNLNIKVMPYGLSDFDFYCEPLRLNSYNPGFKAIGDNLPMRTIDSLLIDGEIKKADYIKLDVEGSELAALKGASATIRKFSPKLGVSLYHRPNDIFELPLYIKENYPKYNIYVDHYTIHNEETVMYCTV